MSYFDQGMFEDFLSGMHFGRGTQEKAPSKAFLAGLSGDVHKCDTKAELGDWFRCFSEACRWVRK